MVEQTQEHLDIMEEAARLTARFLDESMRADDDVNMAASTGTNDLKFEQVRGDRLLRITHLSGYDDTSAPTRIRVGYWNGHRLNWLQTTPAPLVSETVAFNGDIRLRQGMYAIVRVEGATSGDDLYAALNGYWIPIKKG